VFLSPIANIQKINSIVEIDYAGHSPTPIVIVVEPSPPVKLPLPPLVVRVVVPLPVDAIVCPVIAKLFVRFDYTKR
jgi:hypothetical protein